MANFNQLCTMYSSAAASIDATLSNSATSGMDEHKRRLCISILLQLAKDVKVPQGTHKKLAEQFGVSRWTIWRIWKNVQKYLCEREHLKVTKNYKGRVGRKKIEIPDEVIMQIPLRKRCNIRSMASALNLSKSTVHRLVKWGHLKRHSSALKPGLTDNNKMQRLRWCLDQVDPATINSSRPTFREMHNVIHIDEKWFYMSKASQNFYLAPTEEQPHRCVKHKSHITKVMFFCAVARPIFDDEGNEIFDGKIGCWPLTKVVPAQRNSRNRPAGTLETKPIQHVNKAVIKSVIINKLIPAIRARWPLQSDGNIIIQQDNATPHLDANDADFVREANKDGFNMRLVSQPPNSPDLNVNDLGFFNIIQSIQHQLMPSTIDQLVGAVRYAFHTFESKLLNFVFLSYQLCMREIMRIGGGNNYQIPHASKQKMERMGTLPVCVEVPHDAINQALMAYHWNRSTSRQQQNAAANEVQQENAEASNGVQYLANQEILNMEDAAMEEAMLNLSLN